MNAVNSPACAVEAVRREPTVGALSMLSQASILTTRHPRPLPRHTLSARLLASSPSYSVVSPSRPVSFSSRYGRHHGVSLRTDFTGQRLVVAPAGTDSYVRRHAGVSPALTARGAVGTGDGRSGRVNAKAKAKDAPRKTEVIRLKQNQWVYDVCVERRCTVADIRALNPTVDIDRVLAGQRLVVPRRPSPFDPIERELSRAAQQFSSTFTAPAAGGDSAEKQAGAAVPAPSAAPPPAPSAPPPSAPAPSPSPPATAPARSAKPAARPSGGSWLESLLGGATGGGAAKEEVEEYVLRRKEWVCDVAKQLDVDIDYLRRLNPTIDLDNVRPKQKINIPKSRAARLRQQPSVAVGSDVAGAGTKEGKAEEERKGREGGGVRVEVGEKDRKGKGDGVSLKSTGGKAATVAEATASASASAVASRDKPSARQAATAAAPPLCPAPPSAPSPSTAPPPPHAICPVPSPSAPSASSASAPVCAPPPTCKPPASVSREVASSGGQSGGGMCAAPAEAKGGNAARETKGAALQGVAGAVVGGAGGSTGGAAVETSFFEALIRGMSGDSKQKDGARVTQDKQQQQQQQKQQKAAEVAAPVKQQKDKQQTDQQQQLQPPSAPSLPQPQPQQQKQLQQQQGQQAVGQRWRVHRVRRGEWISSLAADYGISLEQLQEMNPTVDLARVKPGDDIRLPAGRRRAAGAALPLEPADVEAMGGAVVVAAGGGDRGSGGGAGGAGGGGAQGPAGAATGTHLAGARVGMVMPGDSLADIAERYGVAWQELAERNGVNESEEGGGLQVGQILIIPEKRPQQVASIGTVGHWFGWGGGRDAAGAAGGGAGSSILSQAPVGISVSLSIALVVASSLAAAAIMRLNSSNLLPASDTPSRAQPAATLGAGWSWLSARVAEPVTSAWQQVRQVAQGESSQTPLVLPPATSASWVVPASWSAPTQADMTTILALSSLSGSSPSLGGLLATHGLATSAALLPAIDAACRAAADSFLASGPALAAVSILHAPRPAPPLLRLLPFRGRAAGAEQGALGAGAVGGADGRSLARVALAAVPQLLVGCEAMGACVWAEGGEAAESAVDGVAVRGGREGEDQYSVGVLLLSLPPGMRVACATMGEGEAMGVEVDASAALAACLAVAVGRLNQAMAQEPLLPSQRLSSVLALLPPDCATPAAHVLASLVPDTSLYVMSSAPHLSPQPQWHVSTAPSSPNSAPDAAAAAVVGGKAGQGVTVVGIAEGVDLNGAFVASVVGQWLYGANLKLVSVPPSKKRTEAITS